MTKTAWVVFAVAALLLVPAALAHGAPKPREFQTRLLADCEDDVGGNDGYNGPGYDLHSLDVQEYWDGKDMVRFRVVLNGGGASDITLTVDGKTFGWSTSDGTSWTLSGFASGGRVNDVFIDNNPENGPDGERFALQGSVPASTFGGIGGKMSSYTVEGDDARYSDAIPGLHGLALSCIEPFERADYTLIGPGRYAKLELEDDQALLSDTENFLDVTVSNLLQLETQTATLRLLSKTGDATVQFHDPSNDGYAATVGLDLGKRGGAGSVRIVHLAIEGSGGSTGTIDVELTTDLGGRVLETLSYAIPVDDTPAPDGTDGDDGSDETNGSPAIGVPLAVAFLAAVAMRRRP